MLLFGLQDIAVKAKFEKWKALVQNGTFISACLLYTGGVFSGLSHSQRWWDTFVNCGKFGLPNLSLLLLHLERKLLSHCSEMSRLWERLLREWKGHLVTKPVYLQLFTWAVFLCFQIFSEVTSKLTDSRNNDVGISPWRKKQIYSMIPLCQIHCIVYDCKKRTRYECHSVDVYEELLLHRLAW